MIILVGSKIDQASIQGALGKPEYSYYFLMKDFLPVLERLGRVQLVKSTAEIEALYKQHHAAGEEVVFLSFSPPHQAPLGLSCPTIVVFAWEFDSLPSVAWEGNPQNDWRYAFAHLRGGISTSREAAGLVESAMPPGYPVIALPAPVWDRYRSGKAATQTYPQLGERQFPFSGVVIDSPMLGLSADGLVRKPGEAPPAVVAAPTQFWQLSKALFKGWLREIRLPMEPALSITPAKQASTPAVAPPTAVNDPAPAAEPPLHLIDVSGVVYTTVLNPADSRKNWVELITAFCWAFKDSDDATLIVKMTHHDLGHYRIVLMTLLSRLAPFNCRVLVLHGFLEDEQYRQLIEASSYYVNASSGEGLCLPLMEFLSAGKPVIAPTHTAMADYVNERLAFLVKCSLEPFCWPHDPTGIFMTHRHRLNWESLVEAYQHSYRVAKDEPERYREMAEQADARMQAFASIDRVAGPLGAFLGQIASAQSAQVDVGFAGGAML
ncbi:MAG TPA: glycosyltransferase [Pseudomonas sp.]|nr:glycosyltransferase [Pseudomonas sp.]